MFAWGLFPGETSGSAYLHKEAMESLVLDAMVVGKDMESLVPNPKVIASKKELEPPVPTPESWLLRKI